MSELLFVFLYFNLRSSEIHLFYNLGDFYWHFLEILWLFIFLFLYSLSNHKISLKENGKGKKNINVKRRKKKKTKDVIGLRWPLWFLLSFSYFFSSIVFFRPELSFLADARWDSICTARTPSAG